MTACLLLTSTAPADTTLPWHAEAWPRRAVVAIDTPSLADTDVAAIRIHHGGAAQPTADDYRIFDESGRPVPYQITWHHPARDTLISFRCAALGAKFAIYYGNPNTPRDPLRAIDKDVPGTGPPLVAAGGEGWIPRAGLVLSTRRRPREADNPKSIEQLAKLVKDSLGLDGAAYRTNISDGLNPFGDSDYFISAYRGWIRLPRDGTYGFCTASNEASFSFLDGRELVHWPGRHTEQRGKQGQKNATHDLKAGLHYIEYYHEEVLLYQVAFLGWKPPGARHYTGIPGSVFVQPHRARVERYESAGHRRDVALRPVLIDNVWPTEGSSGQYTRYRFFADPGAEAADLDGWTLDWSFGDGQSARGAQVEHIYLGLGNFVVTLAAGPPGARAAPVRQRWALTVFPIEHLAGPYRAGDAPAYKPTLDTYDRDQFSSHHLAALAHFYDGISEKSKALVAARALLLRGDASAADLAEAHLLVAEAGESQGDHLASALEHEPDPVKRLSITAKLIELVGVEKGDLSAAEQLNEQAKHLIAGKSLQGELKAAFRAVAVATGNACLQARRIDAALESYHLAESLAEAPLPIQVRRVKFGAHQEAVARQIEAGRLDAALAFVRQWRDELPSELIRGEILYWLGKVHHLRGDARRALMPLSLAIELGEGNAHEAEARYLLAQSHRATDDNQSYRDALRGLVNTGLSGPFREKALAELGEEGKWKERRARSEE